MKEITKMSRLTGELEKLFRLLNQDYFNNDLPTPVITVIPTAKAYAHYVPYDIWDTKGEGRREINIASGTLNRPVEKIVASMLHEMVHMYNDVVLNEQDTSRAGTYHNKVFKREAEAHGLIVSRTEKYGWSFTEPTEALFEWVLDHDELREIEMCRDNPQYCAVGIGTHTGSGNGGIGGVSVARGTSNSRKYVCPRCKASVRATKKVNIICGDCFQTMQIEE